MDSRLRQAVDASVGWYEDLFTLHGVGSTLVDGLWSALAPPPPLHSDAVVVEPGVTTAQLLERMQDRAQWGCKDSFASLDLVVEGLQLLFSASWIYLDPAEPATASGPEWSVLSGVDALAEWTGQHDTSDVLLAPLLRRAHFKILARYAGGGIVSGAVARLGSGVVDVSNVWAAPGHAVDWAALADAIWQLFPGRPLVGYERDSALDAAVSGGFVPVGELRVWVR